MVQNVAHPLSAVVEMIVVVVVFLAFVFAVPTTFVVVTTFVLTVFVVAWCVAAGIVFAISRNNGNQKSPGGFEMKGLRKRKFRRTHTS